MEPATSIICIHCKPESERITGRGHQQQQHLRHYGSVTLLTHQPQALPPSHPFHPLLPNIPQYCPLLYSANVEVRKKDQKLK